MGVTHFENRVIKPIKAKQNAGMLSDYELSDNEASMSRRISVEQLNSIPSHTKFSSRRRELMMLCGTYDTDGINIKRNMGSRKWRRVEHARSIFMLTDLDDICEDFSDIVTQTPSAFERLLSDKSVMKKWNDFIEKDEQEQLRILEEFDGDMEKSEEKTEGWSILGGKSSTSPKSKIDRRTQHPAYSAKSCYNRISGRNKKILMGRRVNWALIDHLEQELRETFSSDPNNLNDSETVYIADYPLPSDRMIAHIVSEYLWLNSKSITLPGDGKRITEIRNNRSYFVPPYETLINYLEDEIFKRKIDFVPYNQRDVELTSDIEVLDITCSSPVSLDSLNSE